jgi:hypothetical protein
MTDTSVFRLLLRTAPAVIVALVAAALFISGVAAAQPGAVKHIQLDPATNTIAVSGAIACGNRSTYAITPGAGRNLSVEVTSPEDNARISVAGRDGEWIASEQVSAETVATDGDYTIVVTSARGKANYKVAVVVS